MDEAATRDALAAECGVFCRYLLGEDPPGAVVDAYRRAHEIGSVDGSGAIAALDRAVLVVARSGPGLARMADAYAAVFAGKGLLRRKLILLVAILESLGPSAAILDTATPGSRLVWVVALGARLLVWGGRVAAAAVLVGALGVWFRMTGSGAGRTT